MLARRQSPNAAAELSSVRLVWLILSWVVLQCSRWKRSKGDSTDTQTLVRLGGLVPGAAVYGHEYWRLFTALFLHTRPPYLGLNMLASLIFGVPLERRLGALRFGAIYFGAGLLSMAAIVALTKHGYLDDDLLVSASGASSSGLRFPVPPYFYIVIKLTN
jgi:membrane associated rhomboid family serine protease